MDMIVTSITVIRPKPTIHSHITEITDKLIVVTKLIKRHNRRRSTVVGKKKAMERMRVMNHDLRQMRALNMEVKVTQRTTVREPFTSNAAAGSAQEGTGAVSCVRD
jgi:hypothetical protein